jgi:hypothetical protein
MTTNTGTKPQDRVNLCKHWRQGLITHLSPPCPFCEIDKLKDKIAMMEAVEPMTVVADRYAHRMAMVLECVLMDRTSDRWWNEGIQLIGEYRSEMNSIHEQHSPTHMGEPLRHNAGDKPPQVGLD